MKLGIEFLTPLIVQHEPAPPAQHSARFTFTLGDLVFSGENMSNTMQSGSIATLSIQWVDNKGNPAKVDGATDWVSSNEEIVRVEVAAGNPLICNVYSEGAIGAVQVQATADADLGEGIKTITAVCDITVIAGQASGGTITFSQSPAQGNPPPQQRKK